MQLKYMTFSYCQHQVLCIYLAQYHLSPFTDFSWICILLQAEIYRYHLQYQKKKTPLLYFTQISFLSGHTHESLYTCKHLLRHLKYTHIDFFTQSHKCTLKHSFAPTFFFQPIQNIIKYLIQFTTTKLKNRHTATLLYFILQHFYTLYFSRPKP